MITQLFLWNDYSTYTEEKWGIEKKFDASRSLKKATDCETYFGSNLATNIKNDPYSRIRSCNEILEGHLWRFYLDMPRI